MTKTRALVYHRLYDSVAERIKHTAFKRVQKSSNPVRTQ